MTVPSLRRARAGIALAALLLSALSACASTTQRVSAGPMHHPASTLLVLGDSLSTGYQPTHEGDRTCTDPAEDTTGYGGWACILLAHLRKIHPGITIDNLALNGEDTCSFAGGVHCDAEPGGYSTPPQAPSAASQWAQALAFLHAHPNRVSPITIELGGNDVLLSLGSANLAATRKRLNRIFNSLRAAAPRSDIIVFDVFNPLGIALAPLTTLNSILRHEASAHHAVFVDLGPVFAGHTAQYVNPNDVHPTDLGQRVMATAIWKAYRSYIHS
jgi:lysophospholipase L1-like esterase